MATSRKLNSLWLLFLAWRPSRIAAFQPFVTMKQQIGYRQERHYKSFRLSWRESNCTSWSESVTDAILLTHNTHTHTHVITCAVAFSGTWQSKYYRACKVCCRYLKMANLHCFHFNLQCCPKQCCMEGHTKVNACAYFRFFFHHKTLHESAQM